MVIGIVGSEAAKFTAETELKARAIICKLIEKATHVVSGKCHLGGIDIWAIEEAKESGIPYTEYPPAELSWEKGYKPRNNLIARNSEAVYCITVRALPESYTGMKFDYCYHCGTNDHVKSGGCWTVKRAKALKKYGEIIVID
jgi:hypothetical protein